MTITPTRGIKATSMNSIKGGHTHRHTTTRTLSRKLVLPTNLIVGEAKPEGSFARLWPFVQDVIDEEEETNANLALRSQPRDLETRSSSRRDLSLERLSCRSPEEFAYIYSNFCQPMEDDVAAD
ncbi:hypothetical protein B296_00017105 [Ensete ventricosum]|uniref:Uncharacterized protein n=1 Tax=Ensete ventricosum TaxID=4639 RepID=A0A426YKZ3_ENSVE|nr:hypothetical protein B296_00017105 [Ensete ventricosum]